MKKITAVLLALAMMLCVAVMGGCAKNQNENESGQTVTDSNPTEGSAQVPEGEFTPELILSADKQTVAPGETVTFTISMPWAQYFADIQFDIDLEGKGKITKYDKAKGLSSDIMCESRQESDTYVGTGLFVATTAVIKDADLYTVEVTVDEDAAAGDTLTVSFDTVVLQLGTDEFGAELYEAGDLVSTVSSTVTVG